MRWVRGLLERFTRLLELRREMKRYEQALAVSPAYCWQGHEVPLNEHGFGRCLCGETIRRTR